MRRLFTTLATLTLTGQLFAQQLPTPSPEPAPEPVKARSFGFQKQPMFCGHHHAHPNFTEEEILAEQKRNRKKVRAAEGTHAYVQGIHNAVAKWGIGSYQSYSIGTTPGGNDIYQGTALNTTAHYTPGFSLFELQRFAAAQGTTFNEGDEFYISLFDNYLGPPSWVSDPLKFEWEELGRADYEVTVEINTTYGEWGIGPFSQQNATDMMRFYDAVLPIIYEIYGPPSHPMTVSIVNDPFTANSNVYYHQPNHISSSPAVIGAGGEVVQPRLMVHELIHAWRDNVVVAANEEWKYDAGLSGFEEGFAESVALAVMDLFIQRNPNFFNNDDFNKRWDQEHSMMFFWEYDFANHPQVTTEDYWSADQATGSHWLRYGLGAAAWRKCYIENPNFFKEFNAEYYRRLNADHNLTTSRELMIEITETVMDEVERTPTRKWVDEQRILDCKIIPGRKAFMFTFTNPTWQYYWLDNRLYHIETHESGKEWSWDIFSPNGQLAERWFHQLNNTSGTFSIYDYTDTQIHTQSVTANRPADLGPDIGGNILPNNPNAIKPVGISNHPIYTSNGNHYLNPGAGYIVRDLDEMGLYRYHLDWTHEGITAENDYYKLHGSAFANQGGVFGGIHYDEWPKAAEGRLWVEHENHGEEAQVIIQNGAFREDRAWTSIPETDPNFQGGRSERTYSDPGQIHAIYIEPDCSDKKIDFRTIGYGEFTNFTGAQQILLNVDNMEDIIYETASTGPVCEGDEIELSVFNNYWDIFENDSRINYKWLDNNGAEISEETIVNLQNVTPDMAGTYTVQVEFFGCPIDEYEIEVEIKPGTSFSITDSQDMGACEGEELQLDIENVADATYSWTGPNGFTSDERNPSLADLSTADAGAYTVVVSAPNCDGENITKEGTINVSIDPGADFELTPQQAIEECENNEITLTIDNIDGATYSWTGPNGYTSSDANPQISNLTTNDAGNYSVTVSIMGCNDIPLEKTTDVQVVIIESPTLDLADPGAPLEVCEGDDATLTVESVANATYSWTGPNGFTSTQETPIIPNLSNAEEGTYNLTVSIPGCKDEVVTDAISIEVDLVTDPTVELTPLQDISVCEDEEISLGITDIFNNATYSWTGPNDYASGSQNDVISNANTSHEGTYTIEVTVPGCDGEDITDVETVNVVIEEQPTLELATIETQQKCEGENLDIALDYGLAEYTWIGPNGFSENSDKINLTNLDASQSGMYTVSVSIDGCKDTKVTDETSFQLEVRSEPQFSASTAAEFTECVGQDLQLSVDDINESGAEYSWTGPNGYTSDEQNPIIAGIGNNYAGTYTVTIRVPGCKEPFITENTTTEVTLSDYSDEEISLTDPEPLCPGDPLNLVPFGGNAGVSFEWFTPDGDRIGSDRELDMIVPENGDGDYRLVVNFPCPDQSATASASVEYLPSEICDIEAHLYIPDIFSPNGDTENDVYYIRGKGVENVEFRIYNRWGDLVFQTTDMDQGWDGRINGQVQNSNVFAYKCFVRFRDGKEEVRTGNITLIK